ncbi:MAG: hypothetical protein ACOY3P_14060 [Planctomycetota bacterium]
MRLLFYLWASPATLLGLLPLPLVWLQGGKVHLVRGVIEIQGGIVTWLLGRRFPWIAGCAAMTLGHVVWGRDQLCLDGSREHEHVHVRQYERWGPFFLPAYLLASVWVAIRGRHPYFDNPFEREAYEKAGE